eukprot:m.716039 g.716039  ORF g.716039 m.716039 type:complete len:107 (+) comp22981_c0_seq8:398-718(+)
MLTWTRWIFVTWQSTLVAAAPMMFAKWASEFKAHSNQLPLFNQERSNSVGGDPNIRYYHSHWKLDAGREEALLIEATPPPCSTWNFQLYVTPSMPTTFSLRIVDGG